MKKSLLVLVLAGFLADGAFTADLSKYTYLCFDRATMEQTSMVANVATHEIELTEGFEAAGYQVISENQLKKLSVAEQAKVAIVRFASSFSTTNVQLVINLYDYVSDRLVASCKGKGSAGFPTNYAKGTEKAVKDALKQAAKAFKPYTSVPYWCGGVWQV
jgi:hypothetical protein